MERQKRKMMVKRNRKGNRIYWAGLVICIAALVLGGCGMFPQFEAELEDSSAREDEDLIVIGFSQLGSESIWRTANTASMQNALTKENGFFLIMENARQRQENQIKSIRSFISQRVDYIVFSPMTSVGWDTVLQEAKDAGIPVIVADRTIDVQDESLYTAWVGADFYEEGEKAGQWLEKDLQKRGLQHEDINIVILTGTEGSSSQIGRSQGFRTVAKRYDNWHILAEECGDFTTTKAKEVMEDYLNTYPDIDVVVSQNDDMTFGALEAIHASGKSTGVKGGITVISFDATRQALKLVEQGTINVDIECNPEQGETVAEIIHKLEQGETVKKRNPIEEKVFTAGNVTQYLDSRTY